MVANPKDIGQQFVQVYYEMFDKNRSELANLYMEDSMVSYEGAEMRGKTYIMQKFMGLPFQSIQHIVSSADYHFVHSSAILICVVGKLKTDNDPPQSFCEVFYLQGTGPGLFYVKHQMFRLSLHDI